MLAPTRQRLRRTCTLVIGVLGLLVAPAAHAQQEIRTLSGEDGVNPTVALDVKRVEAVFDRTAGSLAVAITLHHPAAEPSAGVGSSVALWFSASPGSDECAALTSETVGDTYLSIGPRFDRSAYAATVNVNFRQEYPSIPVSVSDDRLVLRTQVDDALLVGADLRCVDGVSSGRGAYDPTQPGGGETGDDFGPVWFAGFDPNDPRNKPFVLSYKIPGPQRLRPASRGFVNLRGPQSCSHDCRVQIAGYAVGGNGRRIVGLDQTGDFRTKAGDEAAVGFDFTAQERRRLARAFARWGKVRFTIKLRATDEFGRTASVTRRVTLLPARRRSPVRRPPARPTTPAPAGDRDCSDFSSQAQAQSYFRSRGGSSSNNVDRLDADHDGIACEALP